MGGSQSATASVTQENNIITVNKSTVDLLSQMINKTTSDTIVNQAQICSASSNTTLKTLFQNLHAQGDIIIDNTMNSKVTLDISCINSSTISTAVSSNVSSDVSAQIDTVFKNMAQQAAAGQASTSSSTGFNPFAAMMNNASSSDIKQFNTATTTNDAKTSVTSIIQNITATTFTTNVMNELKANVATEMSAEYSNMYAGGNINITSLMDSVQNIIAKQVTDMGIGNTISSKLVQTFGVAVKTAATTETVQTSKAEASAVAASKGLLEGLISIGIPGLGSSGGSGSSLSCCICCIICILLYLVSSFMG